MKIGILLITHRIEIVVYMYFTLILYSNDYLFSWFLHLYFDLYEFRRGNQRKR